VVNEVTVKRDVAGEHLREGQFDSHSARPNRPLLAVIAGRRRVGNVDHVE
jgi:hypothetical protein